MAVRQARRIPLARGGALVLEPGFLPEADADRLFEALLRGLPWSQRKIRVFGRWVAQPRLTAWAGDPGAVYRYSGIELEPAPWPPALFEVRERLEARTGGRFNGVLCNLYRDGSDSVGWHADAEPELGRNPLIGSVSLGATRRFLLRSRNGEAPARVELRLSHGSLLVMAGTTQHHYRHRVPKERSVTGARINLTFRCTVGYGSST